MKRIIILVLLIALSLCACGKKDISEQIKDSMSHDLFRLTIPADLEDYSCKEESDGLYLTCKVKYTHDWEKFSPYLHEYLDSLFSEYKEIESALIIFRGLNDECVYNCLYARDGDTYEIIDELQVY